MSLVPMIFRDWWDDWDRERSACLVDQNFGNVLNREDFFSSFNTPFRPGYYRPWRSSLIRQNSGKSNITSDSDKVQVVLDVQQFAPNEISVKIQDNTVIIEAKHDEKQDEHGFISRHFTRKYLLPKDVVLSEIVSSLSSDGVLTVTAPKKVTQNNYSREVPIIQTGAPAIQPTETNIIVEHPN